MGDIVVTNNISFLLVFLEGILSFFSPCVIPLIPVYMSILAGSGKKTGEDGVVIYERKIVFLHTLFFVVGISFAFFILGMSFSALGNFFSSNKLLFTRMGGVLIVVLGLFQLGIFDLAFLQKERKISLNLENKKMNPILALAMGFTFSFAWTPCIGPALSSVLIMASGASSSVAGNMLVFVYAIGFLVPFLLLGLFTTQVLNFLKAKQKLLKYTIKAGGIILIIMGVMTYTGWLNGVSGYLNSISTKRDTPKTETDNNDVMDSDKDAKYSDSDSNAASKGETTKDTENREASTIPAFDFTLTDQYGNEHTLSDYKGKVVFLNFFATWCSPCKKELPDIEKLYQEYNLNQDDVVFLGITNPQSEEYPNNQDEDKEKILSFIESNEYTFPIVFDETGEVLQNYNISAFPTTFMIDKEGNIAGFVPGMMTEEIMRNVISQVLESTK